MTSDHDVLLEVRGDVKSIKERLAEECGDHETRIRALEAFENRILGWAGIVGAVGGVGGAFLGSFVVKLLGW